MSEKKGYELKTSNWWLRSPNVDNSNNVRNVNTSGALDNNNANNSNGVVPDCTQSQIKVRPSGPKSVHKCKEFISCPLFSGERSAPMPLIQDLADCGYPRRDVFSTNVICRSCIMGEVYAFGNLYHAMKKCTNGVKWKDSVAKYFNNGLMSTYKIRQEAISGKRVVGKPTRFIIYEPKTREATSTKYKDRVVDKSFNQNYYIKAITKHFIYDNGACQVGKGTDFSRNRLRALLAKYVRECGVEGYVLSLDVKGFFANTKHEVAKGAVANILDCPWAIYMVASIVDSYATEESPDKGIGLGSEINQYTQLAVLSTLDHYIKEELRCKHYQRYMDDMVLLHRDKKYLQKCKKEISKRLGDIGLQLNPSKSQIRKLNEGIDYLGFRFRVTDSGKVLMTVKKNNIKKRKRKIRVHARLVEKGKMSWEDAEKSFLSWLSYVDRGNNYKLKTNMSLYFYKAMGGRHGSFAECGGAGEACGA